MNLANKVKELRETVIQEESSEDEDDQKEENKKIDEEDDIGFIRKNNNENDIEELEYQESFIAIDMDKAFDRVTITKDDFPKVGVDKAVIFVDGTLNKYMPTTSKIPFDIVQNPSDVTVTKIACGYDHMVVQLENGQVFVSGNNTQGQLNADPK